MVKSTTYEAAWQLERGFFTVSTGQEPCPKRRTNESTVKIQKSSVLDLYKSDYRVRRYIAQSLLDAPDLGISCELLAAFFCFVGFGLPPNEEAVTKLLQEGPFDMDHIRDLVDFDYDSRDQSSTLAQKLDKDGHLGLRNLNHLYTEQNKLSEAETCLLREIRGLERVADKKNSYLYELKLSLAAVYNAQRRCGDEELLVLQVLKAVKAREGILGVHKGAAQTTMSRLAMIYREQGRYKEAEELSVKALELAAQVFGETDIETIQRRADLALSYTFQGQWDQAVVLLEEAKEKAKEQLGHEHPTTLSLASDLARVYLGQGRLQLADEIMTEVAMTRQRVLGIDHVDTLGTIALLCEVRFSLGRLEESRDLAEHILEVSQRMLGDQHPSTMAAQGNLGMIYLDLGQYSEAEAIASEVLQACRRQWGKEHPETIGAMHELVRVYFHQGRLSEAASMQREEVESS